MFDWMVQAGRKSLDEGRAWDSDPLGPYLSRVHSDDVDPASPKGP